MLYVVQELDAKYTDYNVWFIFRILWTDNI